MSTITTGMEAAFAAQLIDIRDVHIDGTLMHQPDCPVRPADAERTSLGHARLLGKHACTVCRPGQKGGAR